jgi:hypothetical protein
LEDLVDWEEEEVLVEAVEAAAEAGAVLEEEVLVEVEAGGNGKKNFEGRMTKDEWRMTNCETAGHYKSY